MTVWKKDGRGWIAKFKYEGCQHKREGFESREDALNWEVDRRRELKAPQTIKIPSVSFQQLATKYLQHISGRMQPHTIKQKSFVYRSFIALAGDLPADSVTKQDISAYLEHRREKTGNIAANRDLRELKALYNWAIKQEVLDCRNPTHGIEKYPEDPTSRYIPPAGDVDKVLMAADREEMDLLTVLYHTLGRIGEVLRLTWEDINFEKKWVRLYTRKRRGGELEADYLPMNESLHEVLSRRWEKRDKQSLYVFPDPHTGEQAPYQRSLMKNLCKKAKVKEFGFHAIRHHVASLLNDSGKASMKQNQKLLRHRRQTTTETYLHSIDGDLRRAAKLLERKGVRRGTLRIVKKKGS